MLKDWLTFSKAERYGVIVLFVLVCIVAVYPYFHKSFFINSSPLADHKAYAEVDSFFNSLKFIEKNKKTIFSLADEESKIAVTKQPFKFDPNTVTLAQLMDLGFSKGQATVIENYRIKGGEFRMPDDFKKMYVVDSLMYYKLEPFIDIPPREEINATNGESIAETIEQLSIELNSTDTIELTKLKGIGKGYARRIIAYRQLLGGYYSIDQLAEVYGFPKEVLESIRPNLWIDTLSVKRINVNMVDYQELKKHPYLNDFQAKSIIYYRETQGNISNIDELLKNKLVDKTTFDRLKYYIVVN